MFRVFLAFCLLNSAAIGISAEDQFRLVLDQHGGVRAQRSGARDYPRLAAEFENPRVLLLSLSDWQPHHRHVLIEIAEKTSGHVNVMVLCNDTWQIKAGTEWLLERRRDYPHVFFCEIALDTVWIRDFGPIFAQTETGAQAIDFYYEGTRPKDDSLPATWSARAGTKHVKVPWTIQGGNLMSNGQGLALTTNRIFEDNYIRFPRPTPQMNVEHERRLMVVKEFMTYCNLSQLVVLEPLQNELTRHVDMFASFLSSGDVLVAQIDARRDPINSQILERNVSRLQSVSVGGKPLRVHRVPIPARRGTSWSAYTNAIMVGNLVLIPVYDSDPPATVSAARTVFSKLLPNHTIETIDMTSMKQLQGELHCLSLHVPAFVPLPDRIYSFENARKAYFPDREPRVTRKP